MKVLLVGAGGQGAPCASILAHDKDVREVAVCDIDLGMAEKVVGKIGNSKLRALQLDAGNMDAVAAAAADKDVIVDLVSTDFTEIIMQAALKAGIHYVNSAFSRALWDFNLIQGKKPKLYDAFVEKGLTALLGCGMSAGYTNVIVRHYADQLDTMESVKIRLAKKDASVSDEEEILQPWNPGWSPRIAFMDFVNSTTMFEDGKYQTYEAPFSGIESWTFPEPIGAMQVALHAHEEAYSMPTTFAAKGLRHCNFKYYVNKQVAPLVALGFGSVSEVTVKGGTVNPLDVLLKLVPNPGQSFLADDPAAFEYKDRTKHVSIMIEIIGMKAGAPVKYLVTIPDMNKPRKQIYDLFGTTAVNVALPAIIGMKMIVEGAKKGVIFAEELDADRFIHLIRATGYPNRWQTICVPHER
ncbi:MAG: saccharopine dehydrogenase NADP-binding domain-containing protein [Clostridiales Family XIII bacterium]|nr:saccharopine dehydrogenase NADP-binding domain-containing protein [Clostridiales Family XIII bacterium]